MQTIKLNLIPSLILEAVKSETFFKGKVDKAADERAGALAYNEQAGDDTYQERKLQRGLVEGIEQLKTYLSDFIDPTGYTTADNGIKSTLDDVHDTLTIELLVSDRFNRAFTDSLARLSARYITNLMIADWYSLINPKLAENVAPRLAQDKLDIMRCFNKKAPLAPSVPYTQHVKIDVEKGVFDDLPEGLEITLYTESGEIVHIPDDVLDQETLYISEGKEVQIPYTIDEEVIDDIEAATMHHKVAIVERRRSGFVLIGKFKGETKLKLFSRHDDSVFDEVKVNVIKVEDE
jgi:hypothetical protein